MNASLLAEMPVKLNFLIVKAVNLKLIYQFKFVPFNKKINLSK